MPISPARSLHHIEANSLEELEKQLLRMNLILDRSVEVFQVNKIGSKWFAYFNVDSVAFRRYVEGQLRLQERANNHIPEVD